MTKLKKVLLVISVIIAVLIIIHLGMNDIVPSIKSMHQGLGQY